MKNISKISSIYESIKWYSLLLEDMTYYSLDRKYNITPNVGDNITIFRNKKYNVTKVIINNNIIET